MCSSSKYVEQYHRVLLWQGAWNQELTGPGLGTNEQIVINMWNVILQVCPTPTVLLPHSTMISTIKQSVQL